MVPVGISASEVLPYCPVVARQAFGLWVLTSMEVGSLLGTLEVASLDFLGYMLDFVFIVSFDPIELHDVFVVARGFLSYQ